MEQFRCTLRKRLKHAGAYSVFVFVFLAAGYLIGKHYHLSDSNIAFTSGFFVGVQAVMIYFMYQYIAALKNEEKLKALYIAETDERNKYIAAQIGGTGIDIILCGLALAMVVSGFLNRTVFLSLLAALLFCALVKGCLKIYYNKKV